MKGLSSRAGRIHDAHQARPMQVVPQFPSPATFSQPSHGGRTVYAYGGEESRRGMATATFRAGNIFEIRCADAEVVNGTRPPPR
jgi:hypothetical protein